MASSDYENLTEADYENLPPLVRAGENREAILNRVVEGWVSFRAKHTLLTTPGIDEHPATLERRDLRDDNPDAAPIDLGDLIRRTAETAAKRGVDARIALLGCRVRECFAWHMDRIPAMHVVRCWFSGAAQFRSSMFSGDADFSLSTFSGPAIFQSSTFRTRPWFGGADFRAAEVRNIGQIVQALPVGKRVPHWFFGRLQWRWVRAVGRLQALTRASYWALLAVPVLAGVWPVVRWTINGYNNAANGEPLAQTMPLTWFLAFAAALAVAVGHFVYQSCAPQLIQEETVDDLTDRAEEITRQDGQITEERMRAAIDELQQAADMRPHDRSAWFVKRGKRWVWLPHKLELYRDIDVEDRDGGTWRPGRSSAKAAPEATDPDRAAVKQEVSAADRKRILIEEGEKARYEQAVHERPAWACAAGGCYLLGAWFILCIVLMQTAAVAAAAGWDWLDNWLDQWNP